jgi:hypothetical protein
MLTALPRLRCSAHGLLRSLFEQAWQRRRRRHRRVGCALLLGACVAAAFVAARDGRQGSGPTGQQAVLPTTLVLSGAAGIGVACPGAPNSIACDRVGIAVSLPTPHARLRATIAGRSVQLHNRATGACPRIGCFYSAYLRHAGLLDGALRVHPDQGRYHWYGRHPVTATIRLTATYPDGTHAQTIRRAPLAPGWG